MITEERKIKFQKAAAASQTDVTVVLENVHDPHNIGAILRSCDSVGIREVYVLYNEHSKNALRQYVGLHSASGALKWVDVHFFHDTRSCFKEVRKKYTLIAGTHLSSESKSVHDIDFSGSVAFVFGNEKSGLSKEVLPFLDINFIIPQYGLVQSLNVSVACAVTLFEMSRQRYIHGNYNKNFNPLILDMNRTFEKFTSRHLESLKSK